MTATTAAQQRILTNEREYNRLKADPNYTNVKFNGKTGGLLAIHKDHNFDPTIGKFGIPRGDYERITAEVLYNDGKSVILQSENKGIKTADGLLDGKIFDVKGVETESTKIVRKISGASKQGAESLVLYYHSSDNFSLQEIKNAYSAYIRNSKSKKIQELYYIVGGKLYHLQQKSQQ
jgi:hypothetical protein